MNSSTANAIELKLQSRKYCLHFVVFDERNSKNCQKMFIKNFNAVAVHLLCITRTIIM